jgi:WD40 repeat protein
LSGISRPHVHSPGCRLFRDGEQVTSGSEDGTVRIWDFSTGLSQIVSGQKPLLATATLFRNNELAALSSCGDNQTLRLVDLVAPEYRFLSDLGAVAYAIAFSPSGLTAAARLADNTVQYWNVNKDDSRISYTIKLQYSLSLVRLTKNLLFRAQEMVP